MVEKLQTIVNKFRKDLANMEKPRNFLRQYYDVYCLLKHPDVLTFIGTPEYRAHKAARFHGAGKEIPLSEHPALLLPDRKMRSTFEKQYKSTSKLYYIYQPDFEVVLAGIHKYIHLL